MAGLLLGCRPALAAPVPLEAPPPLPTLPALAATDTLAAPTPPPITRPTVQPTSHPSPTPTPALCREPGRMDRHTLPSIWAGELAYRVYLPPCYGADGRSYPTLYLLGGNIHDDSIWDTLGVDETAEQAISDKAIPPLLIVMPAGGPLANNTSGGPGSYESVILEELIPAVERQYCVWPEPAGRAIGGLSRGGYWALEIAFRFPLSFASVGGHSAALIDGYAGPALNPRYTALSSNLGSLRIYLDIGRSDYLIGPLQQLHEAMAAAGRSHIWQLNEGGHEDRYWAGNIPAYLAWYTEPWSHLRGSYPPCDVTP